MAQTQDLRLNKLQLSVDSVSDPSQGVETIGREGGMEGGRERERERESRHNIST
jgi:hypothetical protein